MISPLPLSFIPDIFQWRSARTPYLEQVTVNPHTYCPFFFFEIHLILYSFYVTHLTTPYTVPKLKFYKRFCSLQCCLYTYSVYLIRIHTVAMVPSVPHNTFINWHSKTQSNFESPELCSFQTFLGGWSGLMQAFASTEVISLCTSVTFMDFNCILHLFACLFVSSFSFHSCFFIYFFPRAEMSRSYGIRGR